MAKIKIGEKEYEGEHVAFTSVHEDWNEYRVGDYVIKIKLVVSDVFQMSEMFDASGNPVFYLKHIAVTEVRKTQG